jgi:hypothetical protein
MIACEVGALHEKQEVLSIGEPIITGKETVCTLSLHPFPLTELISVIPKAGSVFTTQIGQRQVTIYGDHFCYRTYDRSARKFKPKPTIELG